jgi:hypothetical protein
LSRRFFGNEQNFDLGHRRNWIATYNVFH